MESKNAFKKVSAKLAAQKVLLVSTCKEDESYSLHDYSEMFFMSSEEGIVFTKQKKHIFFQFGLDSAESISKKGGFVL